MKFAILGGTGFVGQEIVRLLGNRGDEAHLLRHCELDLYDVDALTSALRQASPDALINCAGYTGKPNVDACEFHKSECLAGNAVLPGIVAAACEATGIPWGHVSSGCIFTGKRSDGRGFDESDPPNFTFRQDNCSFYSGSKALGEEILAEMKNVYVWRLRIPFSNVDGARNYLSKLIRYDRLLQAENSLSQLTEFATAVLDCFAKEVPFGTYNLTNPGAVTTQDVTELIAESGITDKRFQFFDDESQFMQLAAQTPRSNCVLDSSKALAAGLQLTPVRDAIRQSLATWKPETSLTR